MTTQVPKDELIAHTNEDVAALFPEFHDLPANAQLAPLRLPLCLPQGTIGMNSAFTRAYSPELQASGIEMDDWLRFVDGLNIAMTASPPLRVVELVGKAIGFVPHHDAVIASASIQVAAAAGIYVIAKTLSDRYLKRANAEYFAPRGLRVRICKTAAMRRLVGRDPTPDASVKIPTSTKVKNFAVKSGRIAETAVLDVPIIQIIVLHVPIVRKIYNRIASPALPIAPGQKGGMAARRLMQLEGHVLPLSYDVPPPAPQEGIMDKASGLSLRLQTWRARQAEAKVERKRQLLAIQEGRATSLVTPASESESNNSGQVLDTRQARKDRRAEYKAIRRAERGRVSRGLASQVEILDRLEHKNTPMLLWIVVLNADQDAQIEGRELVDNDAEVEEIPAEEWRKEIRREISEHELFLANEDETADQDAQIEGRELVDNDAEIEEIPAEERCKETKHEISEDKLFLANEDKSDSEERAGLKSEQAHTITVSTA